VRPYDVARFPAGRTDAYDHPDVRTKIPPGPALAAVVLVTALLVFVLLGRGGTDGLSPLPAPGAGSAVPLLPGGAGSDASVAQYGGHGGHARLMPSGHRHR
jgi:hypothetical protein